VKGSLNKVSQSFICKCCTAGTLSTDVTDGDKLDIVNGVLLGKGRLSFVAHVTYSLLMENMISQ